jgi:hypothetical protein
LEHTIVQNAKRIKNSPSATAFIHFLQLKAAASSRFIASPIVPLEHFAIEVI